MMPSFMNILRTYKNTIYISTMDSYTCSNNVDDRGDRVFSYFRIGVILEREEGK